MSRTISLQDISDGRCAVSIQDILDDTKYRSVSPEEMERRFGREPAFEPLEPATVSGNRLDLLR